jgi:hypothetical protein
MQTKLLQCGLTLRMRLVSMTKEMRARRWIQRWRRTNRYLMQSENSNQVNGLKKLVLGSDQSARRCSGRNDGRMESKLRSGGNTGQRFSSALRSPQLAPMIGQPAQTGPPSHFQGSEGGCSKKKNAAARSLELAACLFLQLRLFFSQRRPVLNWQLGTVQILLTNVLSVSSSRRLRSVYA